MKALALAAILTGLTAIWGFSLFYSDSIEREEVRGEAVATNYVFFRKAVFDYIFNSNTVVVGTILPENPALKLPHGWLKLRDWRGLVQEEDDGLTYCYVYGPVTPTEMLAVRKLLKQSWAVGWNDRGLFSGNDWPLPSAIKPGNVVSMIRIDK